MNPRPGEVWLANVQGLGSLPYVRLERKIGILPITVMNQLKKALSFALELSDKA